MSAFFAFLHHVSAFTLVATLAVEFVLIRSTLTVESARKLQTTDMVYGISGGFSCLSAWLGSSISRRAPPTTSKPGRSLRSLACS